MGWEIFIRDGEVAQTIALLSTISEREEDQDMVTLSTLHASKGLEWPHVQLVGVTEGMLPFKLDDDDGKQQHVSDETAARLQEERRLMYVGITRAKQGLYLSHSRETRRFGDRIRLKPSRFLDELPQSELQRDGADPEADAANKKERASAGLAAIQALFD